MTATFRIEQGLNIGPWGRAVTNIDPASISGDVTLRAQDVHLTYTWTVTSQPDGSSVTPVSGGATCALTCEERGGYLVRLVVDDGLATEDVMELYLGVPLENSTKALPAWNETNQDNSESPFTGAKGWWTKLERFVKWADVNIGAGGAALPTGVEEYWIDATNGVDDLTTGRGNFGKPYASLKFAAENITPPASMADLQTAVIFHVLSGEYSDAVTILPYRWGHAIDCVGGAVRISGTIRWEVNSDVYATWGVSLTTYPPTLMVDGGASTSSIADIDVQRVVDVDTATLTKLIVGKNLYFTGVITQLASGDVTRPTGNMALGLDNCFGVGTSTWLNSEAESLVTPVVRNRVLLSTQACGLNGWAIGDVSIAACYDTVFAHMGVSPNGDWSIIENYNSSSPGFVNCTFNNPSYLGSGIADYSTPVGRYLRFDAYSFASAAGEGISWGNVDVSPDPAKPTGYVLTDRASGVGVDSAAFSGNLAPEDYDVQKCLEKFDTLSAGGGPLGFDAIYVDAVRGGPTGDGSFGKPVQTIAEAFALVAAPTTLAEWRVPLRFCFMPGAYAVPTGGVDLPQRQQIEVTGLGYRIYSINRTIDVLQFINDDSMLSLPGGPSAWSNNRRALRFSSLLPGQNFVGALDSTGTPRIEATIRRTRINASGSAGAPNVGDSLEFYDILWWGRILNEGRGDTGAGVAGYNVGKWDVQFHRCRSYVNVAETNVHADICGTWSYYVQPPPPPPPPLPGTTMYEDNGIQLSLIESALASAGSTRRLRLRGVVRTFFFIDSALQRAYPSYSLDADGAAFDGLIGYDESGVFWNALFSVTGGHIGRSLMTPAALAFKSGRADSVSARWLEDNDVDNVPQLNGFERPYTYATRLDSLYSQNGFPADSVVIAEQLESGVAGFYQMEGILNAYSKAKTMLPGGCASRDASHRVVVLVPPGTYIFTAETQFVLDGEFVDLIALHNTNGLAYSADQPNVYLTGSHSTSAFLRQTAQNIRLCGLKVNQGTTNPVLEIAAPDNNESVYEGLELSCNGAYAVTVDSGITTSIRGTWRNCQTKQGLFSNCTFSGRAYRCRGSDYSFGGGVDRGTFDGYAEDCESGAKSFGYADNADGTFYGIAKRCVFGTWCVGACGDTTGTYQGLFGGTIEDCVGEDYCVGWANPAALGAWAAGKATRCKFQRYAFGVGHASALCTTEALDVEVQGDSFGSQCTGKLRRVLNLNRVNGLPVSDDFTACDCTFEANGNVIEVLLDSASHEPQFFNCTLVAQDGVSATIIGTGGGSAKNVRAAHNRLNTDADPNITNLIETGYNVVDAQVTACMPT